MNRYQRQIVAGLNTNQRDLEMQTYILNGEQANKVQVGATSKAHEGTEKQDV